MSLQEEREFIAGAFQKLKERGWFPGQEFEPSVITEQEIAAFEKEHQMTLPSLYKTFLTACRFPQNKLNSICSIIEEDEDLGPQWLTIYSPKTMGELSERMEVLQEIRNFCELPEDCFRNLLPIGDWGAGWGPLCIDLSRPENEVDENNEDTWSLVWFDHEDFDWDEQYLGEDGLLHGMGALPNLRTLLDWYFYGVLEERFEQEERIKPTYEWYQETLRR